MPARHLDHIQLAMPPGQENDARAFYQGMLGITEVLKPPHLAARGGCWFENGPLKVHLGVEVDFIPARKAHPAFIVDDLRVLATDLERAGYRVVEDQPLQGYDRLYVDDPFGNRIELMEPKAAMTDRVTDLRTFYAHFVASKGSACDPRIEQAFAAVPREPFAGPGPWSVLAFGPWGSRSPSESYVRTPNDDPAFLYQDTLIALDTARGINIGEPGLHARCLDQLALREGDTVLHVGAGSGYYTALLAHLVGPAGRVYAYEIDPILADRAARNLAELPQVELHARSGIGDGLPEVDCVYVNAGITQPSRAWLDALRVGGRLLFPLQPVSGLGGMLLVTRLAVGNAWPARFISRAIFIGCAGPQDEATSQNLVNAFSKGGADTVRSLHLDREPDTTCWCAGDDWWLSTKASNESGAPTSER